MAGTDTAKPTGKKSQVKTETKPHERHYARELILKVLMILSTSPWQVGTSFSRTGFKVTGTGTAKPVDKKKSRLDQDKAT